MPERVEITCLGSAVLRNRRRCKVYKATRAQRTSFLWAAPIMHSHVAPPLKNAKGRVGMPNL